jgi:membrane-associated PAP2 superfamily phosphatase
MNMKRRAWNDHALLSYGVVMLNFYYIMCRSVTSAQRCARLLERAVIRASVVKAPKALTSHGCGYALRLRGKLDEAVSLLRKNAMPIGKIYAVGADGEYREVSI